MPRNTTRPIRIWRTLKSVVASSLVVTAGCAAPAPSTASPSSELPEDGVLIPNGKEDDFFSLGAREYVIRGTDRVTLEAEYVGRSEEERLARARRLVALRQIALSYFLTVYLIDKEGEPNAGFGGFDGMAKAGGYESLNIRSVGARSYDFDFEQIVAAPPDLMSRLPTRAGPDATSRTFTLTVGVPSNDELARLRPNEEWYAEAPWENFDPETLPVSKLRDIEVTIAREERSSDAWLDFQRLFEDGVLDVDVHFGWDHDGYHVRHARALFGWLVAQGFTPPVDDFEQITRRSRPFTRTLIADGQEVEIEVRIFYPRDGGVTDPATDEGGIALEEDMRASLASRDAIVYSGHSGPFYGFSLANWNETEEGDLDDSELASVDMPDDRYQVVFAEGCDTYQIGEAFARNPAKRDLEGLDVITTTAVTDATTPGAVLRFLARLIERDSHGRHAPRTVRALLEDLDGSVSYGFHPMYGLHGIDDDPRLHPYAAVEMFGEPCRTNGDCGGPGNVCVRFADGARACTAACTASDACGDGWTCRLMASESTRAIAASVCAP